MFWNFFTIILPHPTKFCQYFILLIENFKWTLEQYEGQYRSAMYAAVKAANPNWKPGQKFDTSILDNVTRELVEATLVKNGNRLVRNSIDVSV